MRRVLTALGLLVLLGLALLPLAPELPVQAQTPANKPLPIELQYVPADAAIFLHVDVARIVATDIVKSIRKADRATLDPLLAQGQKLFGLTPEDVQTVTLFIPKLKEPRDTGSLGLVVTFNKAFDKAKIEAGAQEVAGKGEKVQVVAVNERTALVLLNLGDEYTKVQPAKADGVHTAAILAAATGKHVVVAAANMANLPDEIRGDELPPPIRPFQPLLKAQTLTATLDVARDLTMTVKVLGTSAAHAIECEKALGALLALIQNEVGDLIKDFNSEKDPAINDMIAVMKAMITTTKGAKFTTLGNESVLTVTAPLDLPFAGAFVGARLKMQSAAAVSQSANNLKQIGLAMHNYADSMNGTMPPAAVCDKTAKPLLSWRVLILPYIEQDALYKEFKLDEAWDSEHNKKLLAKMPPVYAIPGKTKPGETNTHYRVFVGNDAGFEWVMGMKMPASFPDGTSNTIMCVTAADAVPWSKPDELEFDPDGNFKKLIGAVVNGRAQCSLFDGSVRTLDLKKISDRTLKHAIMRSDGMVLGEDW